MSSRRFATASRAGRTAAAAALVAAAALAGAGHAAAAAHRSGPAGPRASHPAAAGTISTVAGGVGGPALATGVSLYSPCGVSFGAGRVYVGDANSVREVSPQTGRLTTPAGTGEYAGLPGNGGPAADALVGTCWTAVDQAGNIVISDSNEQIRVVAHATGTFYGQAMKAGHIYPVAGDGAFGFSGDGGPAIRAQINGPEGIAVDARGNLVFADTVNRRVRVVAEATGTFYGQAMHAGNIYTVAGNGNLGFSGDGGPARKAVVEPAAVALDATGNLVISDFSNRIRVVAASAGAFYGQPMKAGHIYTVAGNGTAGFAGDGSPATSAELNGQRGVAVDGAGNLVIADTDNQRIRVVAHATGTSYGQPMHAGDIYTVAGNGTAGFAGDGGPAASAELQRPLGVAVDGSGNLVIPDTASQRVRVVAHATGTSYGQPMHAGDIYTVAGNGTFSFSGDGGPATSAQMAFPRNVAVDGAGNLLIADAGANRIRVTAAGSGTFYGKPMKAGHIYTVAGDGTAGFSGDGGPATSAGLTAVTAAADKAGNLLIADGLNNRVRVVAASTGTFYGQAMTAGHIYTVAGNGTAGFSGDGAPATSAGLDVPEAVTPDGAGNLVIADTSHNRIRVVAAKTGEFYGQAMTTGDIYTVAGLGGNGFGGDGGPATSAFMHWPASVAVDGSGNLVIADQRNERIRVVAARTGTFYGVAMAPGDIYTVAGVQMRGFTGDGRPATRSELNIPTGVAVDRSGNVLIADGLNGRIRMVSG